MANVANVVNSNANINLDNIEFMYSTFNVQFDSSTLAFMGCSEGVMNGSPFYNVMLMHNNSSFSLSCSSEVYEKCQSLERNQRVSVVVRIDMRNRRNRVIDIG